MSDFALRVKDIQRTDPSGKAAWWTYADAEGGGKRDPTKHDDDFLQYFISQYDSGAYAGTPLPEPSFEGGSLGELFREGQRNSSSFKQAWSTYNQMSGNTMNDPMKASKDTLVAFLEFAGQQSVNAMGMADMSKGGKGCKGKGGKGGMMGGMGGMGMMNPMMVQMMQQNMAMMSSMMGGKGKMGKDMSWGGNGGGWGEPEAKRQRTSDAWMDSGKAALVQKIKDFQRSSEDSKQQWWAFCDGQEGRNRDPARYEPEVLTTFIQSHGL